MTVMTDLLVTIITGAVACIAGLVVSLLSEKLSNQKKNSEDLIERIAQVTSDDTQGGKKDVEKGNSIGSLIEELINSYHRQALSQAGIQFYFSVVAAAIGFGIIMYMALTKSASGELELILKSLPGVAISSVAGLFFKQAGESRQRATELYDRLRTDKQLKGAVSLINSIDDVRIKSIIKAQIAMSMAGLKYDPISIADLIKELYHISDKTTKSFPQI
ncbi:MAG: hypothetical protein GX892_11555 [Thermoanaerobacteraceae bacterium]|nr:hypothetical protein [Thermoanaerobacteraceae bacterium]